MRRFHGHLLAILALTFALSGCSRPETPQAVTQAFWQAVVEEDRADVAAFSTLTEAGTFDGFGREWDPQTSPALGKVIIDGDRATIVTVFEGLAKAGEKTPEALTYLVREGEEWVVDYQRTEEAFNRTSPLQQFLGGLEDLGEKLRRQFADQSQDAAAQLDLLAEELAERSATESRRLSRILDDYAEQLQKYIDELAESIERSLQEENRATDADRQTLRAAVMDLNRESDRLSDPSLESLTLSSKTVAETQMQLGRVSRDTFADQQEHWQQWFDKMDRAFEQLLEELAGY